MRLLLSNHHLLSTLQSKLTVVEFYRKALKSNSINSPEIKVAVDQTLQLWDEREVLPDTTLLKGMDPKPAPVDYTERQLLQHLEVLDKEISNRTLKKEILELAAEQDMTKMRKRLQDIQLSVAEASDKSNEIRDVSQMSFADSLTKPQYSSTGAITNIAELDRVLYQIRPATPVVVFAGRSMGKCLDKNTLIWTNRGLLTFYEIVDQEIYIRSMSGINLVCSNNDNGFKQSWVIRTSKGKKFICSKDHKWLCLNSDFELIWKRTEELSSEDFLVKVGTNIPCGNEELESEDLYYLIGLIQGDGFISEDGVISLVTHSSNPQEKYWIGLFKKYIGQVRGIVSCSTTGKQTLLRKKNQLIYDQFFSGSGRVSYDKRVPIVVRRSSKRCIAAYLRGLFDADGWVESNCVRLGLSNEFFIREIDQLLSLFGIDTSISFKKTKKRDNWVILIRSPSIQKFNDNIGFEISSKRDRLNSINVSNRYWSIPNARSWIGELFRNLGSPRSLRKYFRCGEVNSVWDCSYDHLRELVRLFPDDVHKTSKYIIDNECTFDRVSSIELGNRIEMGDLTVEKTHSYSISGYITHNSTFIDNFVYVNSVQRGLGILYLSLEIPGDTVYFRQLSRHSYQLDQTTAVSFKTIKDNVLTDEQKTRLIQVEKDYKETNKGSLRILDLSYGIDFTPSSFGAFLEKEYRRKKFDVLILDYLQLVKHTVVRGYDDMEIMNKVMGIIRQKTVAIGDGDSIISVTLSQANREGIHKADRNNGAYTLSALAESNELERSAATVIGLYMNDILRSSGEIKYQLLKNREGTLIETPQVTFIDPSYCVVGDTGVYTGVFTEESLSFIDEGMPGQEAFGTSKDGGVVF